MRIMWMCGGVFSFPFALLQENSGCPSDEALV